MFDGNLKEEVRLLKYDKRQLNEQLQKMNQEKSLLVQQINQKASLGAIASAVKIRMEANSFLLYVKKIHMIMLPNGHRGFEMKEMDFLYKPYVRKVWINREKTVYDKPWVEGLVCKRYLTTDGKEAYVHHDNLLLDAKIGEDCSVTMYEPLQQLIRKNNEAVVKVTFPKPMTRAEVSEFLGNQSFDPEVEVVFE